MRYHFNEIEAKWQKYWSQNQTFKADNNSDKPKYYVLDMFPYPSGAGLHVGHPLGYIATDIYARYMRHKGYNVLHPMGYDSFGLPAEQYAIQTGQHPAKTTEENINTYRRQLDQIGFSFDWSREVRTSDSNYYKWTQWIFIQLFESYYCNDAKQARPVSELEEVFNAEGNYRINAAADENIETFTAEEWKNYSEKEKQEILAKYRLTYLSETEVNWCPDLGTVLANDEIVNGVSERGGHPVVRKKMKQWSMRITAYAQRLLDGLDKIDWPQPLKDSQINWIGRSEGAMVKFQISSSKFQNSEEFSPLGVMPEGQRGEKGWDIDVFTTRPDTIFGVSFMTLAPEHELVSKITTDEYKDAVEKYIEATSKRSERDRMADVKTISGQFTGAYAMHPFTGKKIPVWIGDYVLASYGTGAVMAVPCGDQRDYDFAKHFGIEIPNIFQDIDISENACEDKTAVIANSDFISGMPAKKAIKRIIYELEQKGIGKGKINYRLRDAIFSRQRYWGEPFPVYYKDGMPQMIDLEHLPLTLPEVEKYLPTADGKPPLGNAQVWAWDSVENRVVSNEEIDNKTVFPLELNTMPGWAGSAWYFNRYMDADNSDEFAGKEALEYWKDVDLYLGGSEHATGHLLYSRFWQKFMFDKGLVPVDEYAKKLINQGMILGTSAFVYRWEYNNEVYTDEPKKTIFVSKNLMEDIIKERSSIAEANKEKKVEQVDLLGLSDSGENQDAKWSHFTPIHADVSFVNASNELDIEAFKNWRPEYKDAQFVLEDGKYIVGREVEKMSKSKYNVVNPDDICADYGADTLRLYEMFLGPLEQAKPWNTAGITGVHGFLKKMWKLYHGGNDGAFFVSDQEPTKEELKTLHKTIKKVDEDIANFSFNTSVSSFMIAVNELTSQKCNKRAILEPLAVIVSPYAPHIAEELWGELGNKESISTADFPIFEEKYLVESTKNYPISFNGKFRFTMELSLDLSKEEIEKEVLVNERVQEQLAGRIPKKVIVVPGKIVNIVG
ncbi:MAG: class I tRNA ligase family protein [Bacteroidota bacterium]